MKLKVVVFETRLYKLGIIHVSKSARRHGTFIDDVVEDQSLQAPDLADDTDTSQQEICKSRKDRGLERDSFISGWCRKGILDSTGVFSSRSFATR